MSKDRDYSFWKNLYEKKQNSLIWFVIGLAFKDHYYLNNGQESEDVEAFMSNYESGFLEKDFRSAIENDNPKVLTFKNKLALAILFNINLNSLKESFGKDVFQKVIEEIIVTGSYEMWGVDSEKMIEKVIKNNYLNINDLPFVAVLRGTVLASREKEIQKKTFENFIIKAFLTKKLDKK